jgi:hypothetical protein
MLSVPFVQLVILRNWGLRRLHLNKNQVVGAFRRRHSSLRVNPFQAPDIGLPKTAGS